jgi:hypothetical protein
LSVYDFTFSQEGKYTLVFWIITPCCTRQGLPEDLRNISPTVMVPLCTVDCAPIPKSTKLFYIKVHSKILIACITRAEFAVEDSGNNLFQLRISLTVNTVDSSGHAVQGMGLRPLTYWNNKFESRRRHGCLSLLWVVCCQIQVSATGRTLAQMSPTECGVLSVIVKPR